MVFVGMCKGIVLFNLVNLWIDFLLYLVVFVNILFKILLVGILEFERIFLYKFRMFIFKMLGIVFLCFFVNLLVVFLIIRKLCCFNIFL